MRETQKENKELRKLSRTILSKAGRMNIPLDDTMSQPSVPHTKLTFDESAEGLLTENAQLKTEVIIMLQFSSFDS